MQTTFSRGSHVLLTVDQNFDLAAYFPHAIEHLLVSINKGQDGVRDACVGAKLLDHVLHFPQVVSGNAREQVVDGLELQTAMDEVEPGRAVHVHGSTQLALRERLFLAQVRMRHAPVRQGNLNVQWHRNNVRYQHECNAQRPCRQRAPQEDIAKQEPVARHEPNFGWPNPPCLAASQGGRPLGEDVDPRKQIQVETSDAHDGIVDVLLVRNHHFGDLVPHKGELVVRGAKRLEE